MNNIPEKIIVSLTFAIFFLMTIILGILSAIIWKGF